MNDEAASQAAPPTQAMIRASEDTTDHGPSLVRDVLSRIVATKEELGVGATDTAYLILVDLEDDLVGVLGDARDRGRVECERCGARFDWPGQLDAHRFGHDWSEAS